MYTLTCLGLIGQYSKHLYILCIACTYTAEMPLWLSSLLTTKLAPCNLFTVLGTWENQWHSPSAEAKPCLLLSPLESSPDSLSVVPQRQTHLFQLPTTLDLLPATPLCPIPSISIASLWTSVRALCLAPFAHRSPRPGSKCFQLSHIPQHFPERPLLGCTLTPLLSVLKYLDWEEESEPSFENPAELLATPEAPVNVHGPAEEDVPPTKCPIKAETRNNADLPQHPAMLMHAPHPYSNLKSPTPALQAPPPPQLPEMLPVCLHCEPVCCEPLPCYCW
jgi:hypothetical protein